MDVFWGPYTDRGCCDDKELWVTPEHETSVQMRVEYGR